MQHIVVDLEFAPVIDRKASKGLKKEIIEIGAVRLDDNYEFVDSFDIYVSPEYAYVTKKIYNLTGISKSALSKSPKFDKAMEMFTDWIGEERFRIYQWSRCDRSQIANECHAKGLDEKYCILCDKYWRDIQRLYARVFNICRKPSLSYALEYLYIEPEGQLHRACDDAKNTAIVLQTMAVKERFSKETESLKSVLNASFRMSTLGDIFGTEFAGIMTASDG